MHKVLRNTLVLVLATILTLSAQATSAYAHSSEVFDPLDVAATVPALYDIVHAKVTEQIGKGTFYFEIEVADQIPETPTDPSGNPRFAAWNWIIAPGTPQAANVIVRYCSHTIQAPCVDDAWHWESALITSSGQVVGMFPFKVDGPTVKAYVDVGLLGGPALTQFGWFALTRKAPGVSGAAPSDRAPDVGIVPFVR
jgi:hypothetical protein